MTIKRHKSRIIIAILLLLFVWVVILSGLDEISMGVDERMSWRLIHMTPPELITEILEVDVHPPLYYLCVWAWYAITQNQTLFVLRLTAAFASIMTIATVYRLGLDWFHSHWVSSGAALFLGTSGIYVFYSRELRMHVPVILLLSLSWLVLTRALDTNKRQYWLLYGILLALSAYTYYIAGLLVTAQILFILLFHRDRIRNVALSFGVALLLFLPWLPSFLTQFSVANTQSGEEQLGLIAADPTSIKAITEFFEYYSAQQLPFLLTLIGIGLLSGLILHKHAFRQRIVAAALWLVLPVILIFSVNTVFAMYNIRYLIGILPGAALLIGAGIYELRGQWVRLSILGLVAVVGIWSMPDGYPYHRPPHQELLSTLNERYQPGDRIWYNLNIGARGSTLDNTAAYHLMMDAPDLNTDWFIWDAPNDFLDPVETPRVWDIRPYWIPLPDWADPLTEGRDITESHNFSGYDLQLYEAPPTNEEAAVIDGKLEMVTPPLQKTTYRAGETLLLKTWWTPITQPTVDYSIGLYLRDAQDGAVVAQIDNALLDSETPPTSQWTLEDGRLYVPVEFPLPENLSPGSYTIQLGLYYWETPDLLPVAHPDENRLAEDINAIQVAEITIE